MPGYNVQVDEGPISAPSLAEFAPSFAASLEASIGSAWAGNVSVLGANVGAYQLANRGERMAPDAAEQAIKAAGVRLKVPEGGVTREALDLLIQRQQDEYARATIMERTPWSLVGSPVRGVSALITGMLDPLNVAAAFVPVVGEARVATLLGNAGRSVISRAGARTAIGVAEGAAGAALLEPAVYKLHQQLQDDYSMANSLQNIAFGGLLGGGLHVAGGALADAFRGSAPDPYARFAGLNPDQAGKVLAFERQRAATPEMDVNAATQGWDTAMRKAAGLEEPKAPAPAGNAAAEPASARLSGIAADLARAPEAPFPKLAALTDAQARASAVADLRDTLRAELLADTAGRAEPGVIAEARRQLVDVQQRLATLEGTFKQRARDAQGHGLSRKQAEAAARKQIGDERADLEATRQRLQDQVDTNAKASAAEQDIAALDKGEVPERFEARVQERAAAIKAAADLAHAALGEPQTPAHWVIGMVSPETRQVALRTAVADMVQGRIPEVAAVVNADANVGGRPMTADDLRARTERQQAPATLAVGDADAARAASVRVAQMPKTEPASAADAALQEALERNAAARKNLEDGGLSAEALARLDAELKPFDEAVADAEGLGNAARAAALCGIRT